MPNIKRISGHLGLHSSGHLKLWTPPPAWYAASGTLTGWYGRGEIDPPDSLANINDDPTSGSYWGAAVSAAQSLFAPGGGGGGSSGDIGVGGPYNRPGGARAVASAGGGVVAFQPPARTILDARVALSATARVAVHASAPNASAILGAAEQTPAGGWLYVDNDDLAAINACATDGVPCYISACHRPPSQYPYAISLGQNSITNDGEDPIEPLWWAFGPIQPGVTHTWLYVNSGTTSWSTSFSFGTVYLYY